MKLTLILLICFVGVTYQQGYPWSPFYRHSPRLFLSNNYDENDQQLSAKSAYDFELADSLSTYDDDEIASSITDVQARIPFSSARKAQKKFFVTSVFPNSLFPFNFRPVTVTTLTTTALSVVTSTAVLATVQSCIPATQFLTQAGAGGAPVVLTTTCGRRRRDIDRPERQIETQFDDSISPTRVLPWATSSVAPNFVTYDDVKPELRSSQEILGEDHRQIFRVGGANARQRRGLSLVLTVTLTSTSYSFSTTTLKKTVNLSGQAQLLCMPAGFAVC
ncbi:uncharacterized protein LOC130700801 [Daphnia carinata]|uniref:uncharacterized protein LOC130700801 n=1 Tax=Daphnia carinata TaxID=120202 RepID=UPI00257E5E25|nr:uncharacterized protein LOC130700801 [Daphnia carinata]